MTHVQEPIFRMPPWVSSDKASRMSPVRYAVRDVRLFSTDARSLRIAPKVRPEWLEDPAGYR